MVRWFHSPFTEVFKDKWVIRDSFLRQTGYHLMPVFPIQGMVIWR